MASSFILAQAARLVQAWETEEVAVVTEEGFSEKERLELGCQIQECMRYERYGKITATADMSCTGKTREQPGLAEDEGLWCGAAAGSKDFDGNTCCMCTDALLAFTYRIYAWGGGRSQLSSAARLASLFCGHKKPLQTLYLSLYLQKIPMKQSALLR